MVKSKKHYHYSDDGSLDLAAWLNTIQSQYQIASIDTIAQACHFTKQLTEGLTTIYGQPRLEQALEIAEILLQLKMDEESIAAGIIHTAVTQLHISDDKIRKTLGEPITKLIIGLHKMDSIADLQKQKSGNPIQIDKIRKMLLAMAIDIRVVLIKLAERLCFMRGIKSIAPTERQRFAEEIIDIYAPLANRLGIGRIKWELEDLAFRYLNPDLYKSIAHALVERRIEREASIEHLLSQLNKLLMMAHIPHFDIKGRAKHIYSIYLKMQRKDLNQDNIYDTKAVRIIVDTIEQCYEALSIVHSTWTPLINEFDDYIAKPKPNGYRSVHTAVVDEYGKHFEIQIRTFDMHEEAERGVAAHWVYKENKAELANEMTKMTYLRQLIDWQQEVTKSDHLTNASSILDDTIYVITPLGDILDLEKGATPIDAAYHIHTEIGHRCRGAKVNGHIVPLNYRLMTGDRIEIITVENGTPSRDWINETLGFVKTSRARSKISHWFKKQEYAHDISEGRILLDKELARMGHAKSISLQMLSKYFHFKTDDDLFAAIGRGSIRPQQILHAIQPKITEKLPSQQTPLITKNIPQTAGNAIIGADDLMSRIARCCKPIPGEDIIGYITKGRGISIHKTTCTNMKNLINPERFIQIDWNKTDSTSFITDISITCQEQERVLHDITALLSNEKILLLNFNSKTNKNNDRIFIMATLQVQSIEQLQHIMYRLKLLPSVIDVSRRKS